MKKKPTPIPEQLKEDTSQEIARGDLPEKLRPMFDSWCRANPKGTPTQFLNLCAKAQGQSGMSYTFGPHGVQPVNSIRKVNS